MKLLLTPEEEADRLIVWHGGGEGAMPACLRSVTEQFQVIQGRTQLLLTLATITLTITGFSGPKIAETNLLARWSIALGLIFVLASTVMVLAGTLRINWTTQVAGASGHDTLVTILRYRNRKTRLYRAELLLLVIGLTCYVTSVVTFLICMPAAA